MTTRNLLVAVASLAAAWLLCIYEPCTAIANGERALGTAHASLQSAAAKVEP